jgi:hypothetical protein
LKKYKCNYLFLEEYIDIFHKEYTEIILENLDDFLLTGEKEKTKKVLSLINKY